MISALLFPNWLQRKKLIYYGVIMGYKGKVIQTQAFYYCPYIPEQFKIKNNDIQDQDTNM